MIELLAGFVAGAALTVLFGTPIARALARPPDLRAPSARDSDNRRVRNDSSPGFTPLDLGPDPVKWPSERPWALRTTITVPEWPSNGWNDPHFGKHGHRLPPDVAEHGFHAMAGRKPGGGDLAETPVSAPARPGVAQPAPAGQARSAPEPSREKPSERRRRSTDATEEARVRQKQVALEQARTAQQQAQQPARQPSPARSATTAPPDQAEVEQLLQSDGLAGTVQVIMQRTGWEFREAAQYLARLRKGT